MRHRCEWRQETDRAAEQETDPVLQGWHMQRGTYPERTAQGGLWLLHLYYLQLHLKRERERKQKGRRDKNRPILTLVSPCCISLKKKNGTERQAFGFCALGNPLCEPLFSKPVLFQNKSLGQRKKMKRHQISLNFWSRRCWQDTADPTFHFPPDTHLDTNPGYKTAVPGSRLFRTKLFPEGTQHNTHREQTASSACEPARPWTSHQVREQGWQLPPAVAQEGPSVRFHCQPPCLPTRPRPTWGFPRLVHPRKTTDWPEALKTTRAPPGGFHLQVELGTEVSHWGQKQRQEQRSWVCNRQWKLPQTGDFSSNQLKANTSLSA